MTEQTDAIRRETFAEVARAMNLVADIWERDGSDPCRVRITREYANAYRVYSEGLGEPTGHRTRTAINAVRPNGWFRKMISRWSR